MLWRKLIVFGKDLCYCSVRTALEKGGSFKLGKEIIMYHL